jgi:site-specific DNA recombinase
LEEAVWQQVCRLLEDPTRLTQEYERRLQAVQSPPEQADLTLVERQLSKLRQGITRLIDGYTEGYIDKGEFEPRIRRFKERLQTLEAQAKQLYDDSQQQAQLQLIIGRLEEFSAKVKAGLDRLDWHGRRDMIRTLVKRVEIDREQVNVVFRVEDMTIPSGNKPFLQDCWRRDFAPAREYLPACVRQDMAAIQATRNLDQVCGGLCYFAAPEDRPTVDIDPNTRDARPPRPGTPSGEDPCHQSQGRL